MAVLDTMLLRPFRLLSIIKIFKEPDRTLPWFCVFSAMQTAALLGPLPLNQATAVSVRKSLNFL